MFKPTSQLLLDAASCLVFGQHLWVGILLRFADRGSDRAVARSFHRAKSLRIEFDAAIMVEDGH